MPNAAEEPGPHHVMATTTGSLRTLGRDEAKCNTTAHALLQSAVIRIRPMPHKNALSVLPFELRKFDVSKHRLTMADCARVFVRVNFHWQQPKPPAKHPRGSRERSGNWVLFAAAYMG